MLWLSHFLMLSREVWRWSCSQACRDYIRCNQPWGIWNQLQKRKKWNYIAINLSFIATCWVWKQRNNNLFTLEYYFCILLRQFFPDSDKTTLAWPELLVSIWRMDGSYIYSYGVTFFYVTYLFSQRQDKSMDHSVNYDHLNTVHSKRFQKLTSGNNKHRQTKTVFKQENKQSLF